MSLLRFSEECVKLTFRECHEEAQPLACESSHMRVPYQPKIHRVKCLLKDEGTAPELEVEKSAEESDQALGVEEEAAKDEDADKVKFEKN
jgi:hypothetical protein